jgi:hypothetical protein
MEHIFKMLLLTLVCYFRKLMMRCFSLNWKLPIECSVVLRKLSYSPPEEIRPEEPEDGDRHPVRLWGQGQSLDKPASEQCCLGTHKVWQLNNRTGVCVCVCARARVCVATGNTGIGALYHVTIWFSSFVSNTRRDSICSYGVVSWFCVNKWLKEFAQTVLRCRALKI